MLKNIRGNRRIGAKLVSGRELCKTNGFADTAGTSLNPYLWFTPFVLPFLANIRENNFSRKLTTVHYFVRAK